LTDRKKKVMGTKHSRDREIGWGCARECISIYVKPKTDFPVNQILNWFASEEYKWDTNRLQIHYSVGMFDTENMPQEFKEIIELKNNSIYLYVHRNSNRPKRRHVIISLSWYQSHLSDHSNRLIQEDLERFTPISMKAWETFSYFPTKKNRID